MFYGSLHLYEAIRTSSRLVIAAVTGGAGGGNELKPATAIAGKATGQTGCASAAPGARRNF
jgi:hypothetical protein